MDPEMHPRLTHLAMEIVKMLGNFFISANGTARLLRDNLNVHFWCKVWLDTCALWKDTEKLENACGTNRLESMHLQLANSMFGRQMEAQLVINVLLHTQPNRDEDLEVLPIVGPGQVGKGTLVAHVCKDERPTPDGKRQGHFAGVGRAEKARALGEGQGPRGQQGRHAREGAVDSRSGLSMGRAGNGHAVERDWCGVAASAPRRKALLSELTSRSLNFIFTKFSKPTPVDVEDRLRRVLLRAQVIAGEAMGRHVTNQAMLLQLGMVRDAMYRGYYMLDSFSCQPNDEEKKDKAVRSSSSLSKTLTFESMDPEMHPRLTHLAIEIAKTLGNSSIIAANVTARLLRDNLNIHFWCKPMPLDVEDCLSRVLLRAQVIIDEAMGRHITNHAMLLQLVILRDAVHRGYYTLDNFRYQPHDDEGTIDQAKMRFQR
nr:unnamed protein product [Digitaria exilis]